MTSSGSFDASSRQLLEHHLGTTRREEPPLSWPQAAGFLYAVVAAPEPVNPSEWMPIVLGEDLPAADQAEAQSLFDAVTALNDFAATQVFAEAPEFPPGCTPPASGAQILAVDNPFGQWVDGFLAGHHWLQNDWDDVLEPGEQETIGFVLVMLTPMRSRERAEEMRALMDPEEDDIPDSAEGLVERVLPSARDALRAYMVVAQAVRADLADAAREADEAPPPAMGSAQPYRREGPRVGRNDPCPCGSGRKYKHCCGAADH